jgi:hypothetical protein
MQSDASWKLSSATRNAHDLEKQRLFVNGSLLPRANTGGSDHASPTLSHAREGMSSFPTEDIK